MEQATEIEGLCFVEKKSFVCNLVLLNSYNEENK